MKFNFIFTFIVMFLAVSLSAQTDAPDFTVTDLDGNVHNLYEILDSGKVAVVDASATWCSPCWGFHEGHFLKDIHEKYGPNGTDQVVVIFYEADPGTTLADLQGSTAGTKGDWLTGTEYPVINEAPITLSASVWWPLGYPTISVVRPGDKKIIADLYDTWVANEGLAGMEDIITGAFPTVDVKETADLNIEIFPNPVANSLTVDLSAFNGELTSLDVVNSLGAVVNTVNVSSEQIVKVDMVNYSAGMYMINLKNKQEIIATKRVIRK